MPVANFLTLQSVDAILSMIRDFPPLPAEEAPLAEAFGRTLAEDIVAAEDVPGFDRSTVDGFAVRAADVFGAAEGSPALLDLAGECPMGAKTLLSLDPGRAARIWTGGMLPQNSDAVVMLEYSRPAGDQIELTRPAAPGDNVIARGEDAKAGGLLLPAGRTLRPQEMGLLAALGIQRPLVRRKPRVAVISSGDEILPVDQIPAPGQVRDINAYTLAALVADAGGEARQFGIARDEINSLYSLVTQALAWADVVLLSGGSSAGQRDFTLAALADTPGTAILAHGVAISPGKPMILARTGDKSLWGLPGHAAGALTTAEVFIRPLLARLLGRADVLPPWRRQAKAVLSRAVASAQGRRDYIRVVLEESPEAGALPLARPIMGKSGLITPLVAAHALIICPESQEGLSPGQVVDLYPLE